MNWRNFHRYDVYSKSVEGIQVKTLSGGALTIVSLMIVAILLIAELKIYFTMDVMNHLKVDTSPLQSKLTVDIDFIFPQSKCEDVDMDLSNSKGESDMVTDNNINIVPDIQSNGCRFVGQVSVKRVASEFSFMHKGKPNLMNINEFLKFNSSHIINHVTFGSPIPMKIDPLRDVVKLVDDDAVVYKYFIKVVPTIYRYLNGETITSYQYSVTEHFKSIPTGVLGFPGVILSYEFSPIMVEYVETKPSLFHFLTNTCAIAGGIFAVAGFLDRFAFLVSEKID